MNSSPDSNAEAMLSLLREQPPGRLLAVINDVGALHGAHASLREYDGKGTTSITLLLSEIVSVSCYRMASRETEEELNRLASEFPKQIARADDLVVVAKGTNSAVFTEISALAPLVSLAGRRLLWSRELGRAEQGIIAAAAATEKLREMGEDAEAAGEGVLGSAPSVASDAMMGLVARTFSELSRANTEIRSIGKATARFEALSDSPALPSGRTETSAAVRP